jgi:hypothetical protein
MRNDSYNFTCVIFGTSCALNITNNDRKKLITKYNSQLRLFSAHFDTVSE